MEKIFLIIFALLILTSCGGVELNPEWYPTGWAGKDTVLVSAPNGKFNIGLTKNIAGTARLTEFTRMEQLCVGKLYRQFFSYDIPLEGHGRGIDK